MPVYELAGVRPLLGRDVYVAPNASVIGDVHLGDFASVWFGAVVRGDAYPIRIGARTNIQDNAVVHITAERAKTTVGDDVTVGHLALLHGCTVGNRSLIGMGSIVLDNAVIGDECVVAAGALVTPGTVIAPRSLALGRPAKVMRSLTEEDLAWIKSAGLAYLEYAGLFRDRLHPVR
jgi:carbonic anhydrase/acetyltransferase-like protein (isoleucine patch superfamily)